VARSNNGPVGCEDFGNMCRIQTPSVIPNDALPPPIRSLDMKLTDIG